MFTAEQLHALAAMIGNTKISDDRLNGECFSDFWIIDTGATHHVIGEKSWLFDVIDIVPCPMGLPNGANVVATQKGSVRLSDLITLTNILYVPSFSCNLLSISQLTHALSCTVQFTSSMCAIQDPMRKLIETGGRMVTNITVHGASSDLELWHRRMGHPSERVVKLLPPLCDHRGSLNMVRDICFRAKHSRDNFPLSDGRASRIFEKVHCDLWGAYRHESSCGARYFLIVVDDYFRAVWIYLLMDKTEVFRMFMSFVALVNRQFPK